ncbi:unnamed protein product [Chrysoparadoxa australica]
MPEKPDKPRIAEVITQKQLGSPCVSPPSVASPTHTFQAVALWPRTVNEPSEGDADPQRTIELPFVTGQVLTIVSTKHGVSGWWEAMCIPGGQRGFVPSNYLKRLPQGAPPAVQPLPLMRLTSLTSGSKPTGIDYALVEIVDGEAVANDGLAYEVLIGMPGGKLRAKQKRPSDFNALATELLNRVMPQVDLGEAIRVQTEGLLRGGGISYHSSDDLGDYLQSLVEEPKLRSLMHAWLFPGEGLPADLLYPDVSPAEEGRSGSASPKGHRGKRGAAGKHKRTKSGMPGSQYLVLHRWEPQSEDDLDLHPGDVLTVLHSHPDGWWYGRLEKTGEAGYFPRNHLQQREAPPSPPQRSSAAGIRKSSPKGKTRKSRSRSKSKSKSPGGSPKRESDRDAQSSKSLKLEGMEQQNRSRSPSSRSPEVSPIARPMLSLPLEEDAPCAAPLPPMSPVISDPSSPLSSPMGSPRHQLGAEVTFGMRSLEAFDDLVDKGVAVEYLNSDDIPPETGACTKGKLVVLQATAYQWDGASNSMREYASTDGNDLKFVIGSGAVTSGLEMGLQRLSPGDEAYIVSSPNCAYGEAGHPPYVPKHSHVVYMVKLLSVSEHDPSSGDLCVPSGPRPLLERAVCHRKTNSGMRSARTPTVFFTEGAGSEKPDPSPKVDAVPASQVDTEELLKQFAQWNSELHGSEQDLEQVNPMNKKLFIQTSPASVNSKASRTPLLSSPSSSAVASPRAVLGKIKKAFS